MIQDTFRDLLAILSIDSDYTREEVKAKDWCIGHEDTCDLERISAYFTL